MEIVFEWIEKASKLALEYGILTVALFMAFLLFSAKLWKSDDKYVSRGGMLFFALMISIILLYKILIHEEENKHQTCYYIVIESLTSLKFKKELGYKNGEVTYKYSEPNEETSYAITRGGCILNHEQAKDSLKKIKKEIPDAYIKPVNIKHNSIGWHMYTDT